MNQTLRILDSLDEHHEHFQEYRKIIKLIEEQKDDNPDICIESCKALFEGVAHMVLSKLDDKYIFADYKDKTVHALVNMMFNKLKEYSEIEEHSYISIFAKEIGAIRNSRGEVSHGKPYPKYITSEVSFSNMVLKITDVYISYILEIYFSVKTEKDEAYKYEKYEEFNNWLDEQDMAGLLKSYSRALYEMDPVRYEIELKNFYPDKDTYE